jgi:hypothetical protein
MIPNGDVPMKITKALLLTAFNLVLIYMFTLSVNKPEKMYIDAEDKYVFSKGNASEAVRSEVLQQLKRFQEGYTTKDVSKVDSFAEQLFSKNNIVIIGTEVPQELFVGYKEAARLVESDWDDWGDCRFLMDNAQISASGDTAWFSTVGTVKGGRHLSSYFIGLLLSGVLVKENGSWKFQQIQFQSNYGWIWIRIVAGLIWIWLIVNVIFLGYHIYRRVRNRNKINAGIEVTT